MAGARIELDVNTATAAAALDYVSAKLSPEGQKLLLSDIGEYLLRSTRDRAAQELSPDGQRWRALEPNYAKWKSGKRPGVPILKFDNHMIGDQLSHQVEGDTLLVGTNAPYGAAHQLGADIKIPARQAEVFFHHAQGEVSPHFVNKAKSNFAQAVTIPAHIVTLPARPWLGISSDDADEIVALSRDHLLANMPGATS
jgi:phage virion morphogenesis protein